MKHIPAFPSTSPINAWDTTTEGMSLRDYFAAKAMQAMVGTTTYETGGWPADDLAKQSYDMADAMLLAREKFPE